MDIFAIARADKKKIFNNFPTVQWKPKGSTEWADTQVLPSAIGMAQDTEGLTTGTDVYEITFNINDEAFTAGNLPKEDDRIRYTNADGVLITLEIDNVARDKSDISLGLWLCWCTKVAGQNMAGQIDRGQR